MPARDAADVVRRWGGKATYGELLEFTTRPAVRRSVRNGTLLRPAHNVYILPQLIPPLRAGASIGGTVSHISAADLLGLSLVAVPDLVHVTVPRGARAPAQTGVRVHWSPLLSSEIADGVTTVARTVLDCSALLPFREALAVADSALAKRFVTGEELRRAAERRRGAGRKRCLRVIQAADHRAANAFESVLRGIVIERNVPGFIPQLPVELPGFTVHVDLGSDALKVAIEGDSYTFHGGPAAFRRDCERYDELIAAGWLVLRFTWEQVMFRPDWVGEVIVRTCQLSHHVDRSASRKRRTG